MHASLHFATKKLTLKYQIYNSVGTTKLRHLFSMTSCYMEYKLDSNRIPTILFKD